MTKGFPSPSQEYSLFYPASCNHGFHTNEEDAAWRSERILSGCDSDPAPQWGFHKYHQACCWQVIMCNTYMNSGCNQIFNVCVFVFVSGQDQTSSIAVSLMVKRTLSWGAVETQTLWWRAGKAFPVDTLHVSANKALAGPPPLAFRIANAVRREEETNITTKRQKTITKKNKKT